MPLYTKKKPLELPLVAAAHEGVTQRLFQNAKLLTFSTWQKKLHKTTFFNIMDITELDKYFAKMTIGVKKQMAGHLPRKIGNIAVLMFKENFQRESFFGRTWREVKRRIHEEKGGHLQNPVFSQI